MDASDRTDTELLADWLAYRRESAFRALVARYAGLVHRAASRTCGNEDLAADVAQLVFILLAKKAGSLASHTSLGGWLHVTTVMESRNQLRKHQHETLKRERLKTAMETNDHTGETWLEIQPALDDSLAALSSKDREALLLRFYRSMTVSEVATTLGTTTTAAQKRIDRATARLREKLANRGCATVGTLAAALTTGFAADASAAVPAVSLLAAKAIAASSAVPVVFFTAATLKAAAFFAFSAAGIWLLSQFRSIAELERQNADLRKTLTVASVSPAPKKRIVPVQTPLDRKPVDWEEVARQLRKSQGGFLDPTARLHEELDKMDRAELIAAYDEIDAAKLSPDARNALDHKLGYQLVNIDPEYVLKRFFGQINYGGVMGDVLVLGLLKWTAIDQEHALAWFDKQIAAGFLNSKSPSADPQRQFSARLNFEKAIIFQLIANDPATAAKRVAALPQPVRIHLFRKGANQSMKVDDKQVYADLVRELLPEKDALDAITWPVSGPSQNTNNEFLDTSQNRIISYAELESYFERIDVRPAEREACILSVAGKSYFARKSGNESEVTPEDFDVWRAWVGKQAPDLVEPATLAAIQGLSKKADYATVAEIAVHCHEQGAGDEVLLPLLDYRAESNKDLARKIAGKLSDPVKRAEVLEKLNRP